jgi:hypothetical protein
MLCSLEPPAPVVSWLLMAAPFFISGSAFWAAWPFTAAPPFISDWPAFGWSLAPSAAEAMPAPAINATAATVANSDFFIPFSSGVPSEPIFLGLVGNVEYPFLFRNLQTFPVVPV